MQQCEACEGTGEGWDGEPCSKCKWTIASVIASARREAIYSVQYRTNNTLARLLPKRWCGACQAFRRTIERRHQRTSFKHDESNYITCCVDCFEDAQAYWDERWEDYRRDQT